MRAAAAAALLFLAGCGGGEARSPLNDAALAETLERLSEAEPERDEPPPPPALAEIRRDEIELRPGSGCEFSEGGKLLFATVEGDAVARVSGRVVHFDASGSVGPTGGFFTGGSFSLSIGRITDPGANAGEATSSRASLVLTDRSREEGNELRLQGVWRCGA